MTTVVQEDSLHQTIEKWSHGCVLLYCVYLLVVRRLHYMTSLISNVLYTNSAVEHQTLATRIHRNIEAAHPLRSRRRPGV